MLWSDVEVLLWLRPWKKWNICYKCQSMNYRVRLYVRVMPFFRWRLNGRCFISNDGSALLRTVHREKFLKPGSDDPDSTFSVPSPLNRMYPFLQRKEAGSEEEEKWLLPGAPPSVWSRLTLPFAKHALCLGSPWVPWVAGYVADVWWDSLHAKPAENYCTNKLWRK